MRNKHPRRGITTLELAVTLGVLVIIVLAIVELFVALYRFADRQSLVSDVERRAAIGIEHLREAAKGGSAVLASGTVNGESYVSSSSTVAFTLPAIDATGAVIAGTDKIGFRHSSTDPTLLLQDIEAAAGSARRTGTYTITTFVEHFRIRYNTSTPANANTIEVYLETKDTARGYTARTPLTARLRLENK